MARQLTPLGRLLLVLAGLSLVGYGLYKYGVLGRIAGIVAPEKRAEGTVSRDDFGASLETWASDGQFHARVTVPV